jgi:hypothetical protein
VCADPDWGLETALDIEGSHVVAPRATINLVVAALPLTSDLFGSWTYSLKHHLGNELSNSWGGSGNCGANEILETAKADHVTVLASAGDSGAWGKGTGNGNTSPADCQYLLTVGGTTLNVKSDGTYVSEAAWSGSGGGYVSGTAEPSYQSSIKITDKYGLLGKADVAADADPNTGVLVYYSGVWFVVGGTSVACPLWAGFLADVNQARASHGYTPAGFRRVSLHEGVRGERRRGELWFRLSRRDDGEQRLSGRQGLGRPDWARVLRGHAARKDLGLELRRLARRLQHPTIVPQAQREEFVDELRGVAVEAFLARDLANPLVEIAVELHGCRAHALP